MTTLLARGNAARQQRYRATRGQSRSVGPAIAGAAAHSSASARSARAGMAGGLAGAAQRDEPSGEGIAQ